MNTLLKCTLQAMLVLGLSNTTTLSHAEETNTPKKAVLDSIEDGQTFNASAWRKAVDTEIAALDPVKDANSIKALKAFKVTMQKHEAVDTAGDHSEVRAALDILRVHYPAQYERTISNVHYNK